jgi:hypothetical protein
LTQGPFHFSPWLLWNQWLLLYNCFFWSCFKISQRISAFFCTSIPYLHPARRGSHPLSSQERRKWCSVGQPRLSPLLRDFLF